MEFCPFRRQKKTFTPQKGTSTKLANRGTQNRNTTPETRWRVKGFRILNGRQKTRRRDPGTPRCRRSESRVTEGSEEDSHPKPKTPKDNETVKPVKFVIKNVCPEVKHYQGELLTN